MTNAYIYWHKTTYTHYEIKQRMLHNSNNLHIGKSENDKNFLRKYNTNTNENNNKNHPEGNKMGDYYPVLPAVV